VSLLYTNTIGGDYLIFWVPEKSHVFCSVWLIGEHYRRGSSQTTSFSALDIRLKDGQGQLHDAHWIAKLEPEWGGEVLYGGKVEGWLTFEIPDTEKARHNLQLVYQPVIFGRSYFLDIDY